VRKHRPARGHGDSGRRCSATPGWPINVGKALSANGLTFNAAFQNERGALVISHGAVYVPYGGHYGDCGDYHGWVVGVKLTGPSSVSAWQTTAKAGGIWAPGGISSGWRYRRRRI
jgi:hypothetical protein